MLKRAYQNKGKGYDHQQDKAYEREQDFLANNLIYLPEGDFCLQHGIKNDRIVFKEKGGNLTINGAIGKHVILVIRAGGQVTIQGHVSDDLKIKISVPISLIFHKIPPEKVIQSIESPSIIFDLKILPPSRMERFCNQFSKFGIGIFYFKQEREDPTRELISDEVAENFANMLMR